MPAALAQSEAAYTEGKIAERLEATVLSLSAAEHKVRELTGKLQTAKKSEEELRADCARSAKGGSGESGIRRQSQP